MPTPYEAPGANTPKAKLDKLRRDRRRFQQGGSVKTDHIGPFFRDAWHLTDWVWWEHLKNDPALQDRIGLQPKTLEGFQSWVRKQELPMYRCHALATGGKHHTRDGYRFNTATGDAVIEVSAAPTGSPVYKIQQYDLPSMALAYREPLEDEMKNIDRPRSLAGSPRRAVQ